MLQLPITIREIADGDEEAWDSFVDSCPQATFFHRIGWRRVIERGLGHTAHYLMAERGGRAAGVLPLVHRQSRIFGDALISTAFCVQGGPLSTDPHVSKALEQHAIDVADRLDVDFLEIRGSGAPMEPWRRGRPLYVSFRKPLPGDIEKTMLAIPRKQRAMVRKGMQTGLISRVDADIDRLHHIYAVSVRNLGTPVFPKGYFRALRDVFDKDCDVVTVEWQGRAVSSVLNFYFRDTVLPYYGGGTGEARMLAANDFMYWEVMRRAHERGYRVFDFGRSKVNSGSFAFKKHWGFEPRSLEYRFYLRRLSEPPEINPTNPKYRTMTAIWRRLPVPLSKLLGPIIARHLG